MSEILHPLVLVDKRQVDILHQADVLRPEGELSFLSLGLRDAVRQLRGVMEDLGTTLPDKPRVSMVQRLRHPLAYRTNPLRDEELGNRPGIVVDTRGLRVGDRSMYRFLSHFHSNGTRDGIAVAYINEHNTRDYEILQLLDLTVVEPGRVPSTMPWEPSEMFLQNYPAVAVGFRGND